MFIELSLAAHVIEPKYPGAVESIVDLTSCWDDAKLFAHRSEIISLNRSVSKYHEHCCRFLAAAGSLMGDTYRISLECINTSKLAGYCNRLAEREFKSLRQSPGKEKVRFLSALTNKGLVTFTDSAKLLCERIYLISDEHGAVSRLLLNSVRAKALAAGYDVISCYCPLGPFDKLEQIFVPALGLGFLTSNRFHDFTADIDPYRIVNSQRFSEKDQFAAGKRRILFNRKAAAQMLRQAEILLADAKKLHDELETYYIHATDFNKVDALTAGVLRKIDAFQ